MTDKNSSEAKAWEMFLSAIFLSWNQDLHALGKRRRTWFPTWMETADETLI
jgi:hypothetical protein